MLRDKLVEKRVGASTGFRWRNHEIARIEGFSDAVFAFAVTLLVVSLEVPHTYDELLHTMSGFLAFAFGFALLLYVWFEQFKFFRRYGLQDAITLALNGILLFVVLFFVYPLKFLFSLLTKAFSGYELAVHLPDGTAIPPIRPDQWQSLMTVYGMGYIAIFLVFALLYLYAFTRRRVLELSPIEEYDTKIGMRGHFINAGIGLLSVLIVVIGGSKVASWSGMMYMLVGPAMTLHGVLSRKGRPKLDESKAQPEDNL